MTNRDAQAESVTGSGSAAASLEADPGPIVGIDLGTTNSLVAWCDEGGPVILLDEAGRGVLPSVVRFDPATGRADGDEASGGAVGHAARVHAVEHPFVTVSSVKRLMGRGLADVQASAAYLPYDVVAGEHDTARVRIPRQPGGAPSPEDHVFSPQEISAIILRRLRQTAEQHFGRPVTQAVITVPAYFDDAQRQATRDAGRIAGLQVLRIVNEPTAAALAYNLGQKHDDSTVAVFDLGGGTFDVSILRLHGTEAGAVDQVLAVDGDTHLGGDDVDQLIIELIQHEIREQFGAELQFPPSTRQAFRNLAEGAKIRLSTEDSAEIEIELPDASGGAAKVYRRTITRREFEAMITPWIDRALACCKRAIRAANVGIDQIERVIMVGGSTRIPLVQAKVAELFQTEPYTALNPDEVVALGAAVQASILAGVNRDMLLLDVTPLSLGIETMGGAVAKLIVANSTIPARATEQFSTYVDGQTNVKIHVLQGERELVQDCRSLGEFDLRGIPPMPAGLPKIEVTFLVDANGVLNVSAAEMRSGKAASIQIVPNHGLTREEVAAMERASFEHAKEDMTAHQLIDLRNQAKLDIRNIRRQLDRVGDQLDADYRQEIEQQIETVQGYVDTPSPDPGAFNEALTAMDHATVKLAEVAIRQTLSEQAP